MKKLLAKFFNDLRCRFGSRVHYCRRTVRKAEQNVSPTSYTRDKLAMACSSSSNDFGGSPVDIIGLVEEVGKSSKGRKRVRNPEKWEAKHHKKTGLRKNSPRLQICTSFDCCKKKCLKGFTSLTLENVPSSSKKMFKEGWKINLSRDSQTTCCRAYVS